MVKKSLIELQKIDCNCNDCAFMVRDLDRYKQSLVENERVQKWSYDTKIAIMREKAEKAYRSNYNLEKWDNLHTEADKMAAKPFVFNKKSASIQFGRCGKLNKDVSFIPGRCQPETQDCFKHRRDEN